MTKIYIILIISAILIIKFCKKTIRLILSLGLFGIFIYCIVLSIEINNITKLKNPKFATECAIKNYNKTCNGWGYKIEYLYDSNNNVESSTIYILDKPIASSIK